MLPFAIFTGAVVIDFNILTGAMAAHSALVWREPFILAALVLSLPLVYKQKWASDRNVLRGVQSLFILILFTCGLLIYSQERLEALASRPSVDFSIYQSFPDYIFLLSWSFFATVFILIVLGTLRNLIYIKRKRPTAANFSTLMIFIVLYPILKTSILVDKLNIPWDVTDVLENLVFFILIIFIVINSFRVSWINYLNKKQKIACFWGGLILLPMQLNFHYKFHNINPLESFSPILSNFIDAGNLFLSVYLVIAFLALLAHLPTAQLYDRKMRQISSLHNLSRAVSSEFELENLVISIVNLAADVTEADFSWLELYEPGTQKINLVSSNNLFESEKRRRKSEHETALQEWLVKNKEPFLSNQATKDQLTKPFLNWKRDLHSLLAVPLVTADKVVGFLYAGKRVDFGFEIDDKDMLRAFGEQAVIAVENARLVEESIVKERLVQELKIAHDAQMKLLPKDMPRLKGFELDAVCITANEVGGDYYDFFNLGQHKLGIIIGDVSGKGPSAAFYMAEVKGVMEALAHEETSPKTLLVTANKILYRNFDQNTFISMIYGILDTETKSFTFCRAGHCPILMSRIGEEKSRILEPAGMGVGLVVGKIFEKTLEQIKIELTAGDTLLLYTDGTIDARNDDNEEFGEERLLSVFEKVSNLPSNEVKKGIIHQIYSFFNGANATDDLTFIVIKVN